MHVSIKERLTTGCENEPTFPTLQGVGVIPLCVSQCVCVCVAALPLTTPLSTDSFVPQAKLSRCCETRRHPHTHANAHMHALYGHDHNLSSV